MIHKITEPAQVLIRDAMTTLNHAKANYETIVRVVSAGMGLVLPCEFDPKEMTLEPKEVPVEIP